MPRAVMTPETMKLARMTLRALQCVGSLVALATLATGFTTSELSDHTYHLGSHQSNLMLLAMYSGMMYAAWFLVFVELRSLGEASLRPRLCIVRDIDGLFAFFYLCASIALATSDYVSICGEYGFMLKCSNLKASVVFGFLTILPFLGSLALSFVVLTTEGEMPQTEYCVEATPTGALSPIGVCAPPSAKV